MIGIADKLYFLHCNYSKGPDSSEKCANLDNWFFKISQVGLKDNPNFRL